MGLQVASLCLTIILTCLSVLSFPEDLGGDGFLQCYAGGQGCVYSGGYFAQAKLLQSCLIDVEEGLLQSVTPLLVLECTGPKIL